MISVRKSFPKISVCIRSVCTPPVRCRVRVKGRGVIYATGPGAGLKLDVNVIRLANATIAAGTGQFQAMTDAATVRGFALVDLLTGRNIWMGYLALWANPAFQRGIGGGSWRTVRARSRNAGLAVCPFMMTAGGSRVLLYIVPGQEHGIRYGMRYATLLSAAGSFCAAFQNKYSISSNTRTNTFQNLLSNEKEDENRRKGFDQIQRKRREEDVYMALIRC